MKYKLIIDPTLKEEIVLTAATASELTDQIEALVLSHTGNDTLLANNEDELTRLHYDKIECITVIDRRVYAIDGSGSKFRINQRLCAGLDDRLSLHPQKHGVDQQAPEGLMSFIHKTSLCISTGLFCYFIIP